MKLLAEYPEWKAKFDKKLTFYLDKIEERKQAFQRGNDRVPKPKIVSHCQDVLTGAPTES